MDAPERIWAEPDGDTILIHNGAPNLAGLIATGYLTEYIRVDLMAELVEAATAVDDFMRSDKAYERSGYGPKLRAALAKIKEASNG